jgi:anion-transporting  ArsA/GET3 family ATPase
MSSASLIFVTGKGGVGKSTIAALIAKDYARQGKKTLLVEVGETSYYQKLFQKPVSFEPTEIESKFYVAHWQWYRCLKEYVTHVIKLETLTNLFFENAVMKSIIQVAPGLPDIAILGKFTSPIRHVGPPLDFDVVVLDSHATGHALSMLRSPKGLFETIGFGPLGEHSKGIFEVITNPKHCTYITVSLPEELPVTETIEFTNTLATEFSIQSQIWLNKVLPLSVADAQLSEWKHVEGEAQKIVNYIEGQRDKQTASLASLQATQKLKKTIYYRSLHGDGLQWLDVLLKESHA